MFRNRVNTCAGELAVAAECGLVHVFEVNNGILCSAVEIVDRLHDRIWEVLEHTTITNSHLNFCARKTFCRTHDSLVVLSF